MTTTEWRTVRRVGGGWLLEAISYDKPSAERFRAALEAQNPRAQFAIQPVTFEHGGGEGLAP